MSGHKNKEWNMLVPRLKDSQKKYISIERCVWQDKKDFTLEVPVNNQNNWVYRSGKQENVSNDCLFHKIHIT